MHYPIPTYTFSNKSSKELVFDASYFPDGENPKLTHALQSFSRRQSKRTYSSDNTNNCLSQLQSGELLNNERQAPVDGESNYNISASIIRNPISSSDKSNTDQAIQNFMSSSRSYIEINQKSFPEDRNNYHHQTASTQTLDSTRSSPSISGKPKSASTDDDYDSDMDRLSQRLGGVRVYEAPRPPPKSAKPIIKKNFQSERMNR